MAKEVIRKHGDLEIDEDPEFQDVTWVIERVAWALLALMLGAALLGVFGQGPFSRAQARTADGLQIEYSRVARLDSSDAVTLRFRPRGALTTIELKGDFTRQFVVETVLPRPVREQTHGGGLSLDFASAGAEAEQVVVIHVRPRRVAFPARGEIGLRGGPPQTLATVVLP